MTAAAKRPILAGLNYGINVGSSFCGPQPHVVREIYSGALLRPHVHITQGFKHHGEIGDVLKLVTVRRCLHFKLPHLVRHWMVQKIRC